MFVDKRGNKLPVNKFVATDRQVEAAINKRLEDGTILPLSYEEYLEKFFLMYRDDKEYGVKYPLWETSQSSSCEKILNNAGLVAQPSTSTIAARDDYDQLVQFMTWDVNAYIDDNGVQHITAIKGDDNFKDTGEVDVFVMCMSYYEKTYVENGYMYYIRRFSPKPGFTICREAINRDGSISPYCLYAKYVAGDIGGKPYSSKGLAPKRMLSHNTCVQYFRSRGKYYSAGLVNDYKYLQTTFWLKYGTRNSQSIMYGCASYSEQIAVSAAEANVRRVIVTNAQANNFPIGASVSVGSSGDRGNASVHNLADNVQIVSKTQVTDSTVALNLDCTNTFTTTASTYVTSMHWRSGFGDNVLGRCGCPCNTTAELTNGKYPIVFQGIETQIGLWEVPGNAIMDIVSNANNNMVRDLYITNDATKITTDVNSIKQNYKKSQFQVKNTGFNSWRYITRQDVDLVNGIIVPTAAGESGSGTSSGFADGIYSDGSSSGQRELLFLGRLRSGSDAGLSAWYADCGLSTAYWSIGARLSISARG